MCVRTLLHETKMKTTSCFLNSHNRSLNLNLQLPYFCLSLSCFTTLTNLATIEPRSQNRDVHDQPNQTKSAPSSHKQVQPQFVSLIKSCTKNTHLLQLHGHAILTSLIQDPTVSLHLLSRFSLSPFRNIRYSRQMFDQMPDPNVFHYNTMIRAYSMSNSPEEGIDLYRKMRQRGVPTNPLSCSFAIKSCIKFSSLMSGVQIHARLLRDGYQSDSLLMTALMDFYSSSEKSVEACRVFDEIPKRDTVAWNALISCYLRNKRTRDVLCLFDEMNNEVSECKPDDVTCLLLLQACAHLGAIEFGEKVHRYIEEKGYGSAMNICNTLVAMYSRCGCLDKAYLVFKNMRQKNVVSWSAMITGFAINGNGREAIEAFEEMQRMGVSPDEQTFTGVLSACSHCGFVDEGMIFLDRMSQEFGVSPNIHHYGCIVDLLGRAGLLTPAYQLITSMGVKADSTIWRTLLGACRIHRHVALGERVIGHLIELKAQEAGDYVLLLNIYSSVGNWEKVKELRSFLKEKGIQTTPGCSTIELKGVVHEFIADDVLHPRKDEIYEMLDEINKQLKIAGYVAEITSELHNLGAEEKANVLSYHSEKLAIAFGVLATPPGTTIRVAKNLRICVDCHNFAKVLSGVYNREVIIRDRTRFHHFREGHCSCNDYW